MIECNGFWRGEVVDNIDPRFACRVRVSIPQLYGAVDDPELLPWAEPCVSAFGGGRIARPTEPDELPLPSLSHGLVAIPPIGSTVWVAFEQGNVDRPIWFGTWYGRRDGNYEIPDEAHTGGANYPDVFLLKFPWSDSIYIRVLKDRIMELVFGVAKIVTTKDENGNDVEQREILLNTVALDGSNRKILISSNEWDVEIKAESGNINLNATGASITVTNHTKVVPPAKDGDAPTNVGGDIVIRSIGGNAQFVVDEYNINTEDDPIMVGGKMVVRAKELLIQSTSKTNIATQGQLRAGAPVVSGFESRGANVSSA